MTIADYHAICDFLYSIKIVHGATFLQATLRNHKELAQALQKFETEYIVELERENSYKE